ncbi:MAG: cytochrome c biogenesis protein CcsA [Pseudomonadota bacterium]|nr:cytochrome c biogenesis protein CcsA [Pseudomonadota bacterium]
MSALLLPLMIIALAVYAGVFWHLYSHLLNKRPPRRLASLNLLWIGLVLHGLVLMPRLMTSHGIDFNLFNILSLTGWLMLGFSVIFSTYRPVLGLNLLGIPVAALGLLAGTLWQAPYTPLSNASHGLEAHILLSLAAYCLLFMAATQAMLLFAQNRELKHRSERRIWVTLLPSLQSMEGLLFDMLLVGFGLLTAALLLGGLAVDNLLAQHLVHKTFFSVLSWLVFAALLIGHWRFGWRGQRAVRFTLTGFGLLLIGFVGSKLVLELLIRPPL